MKKTTVASVLSAISGVVLIALGVLNGDETQVQAGAASLGVMGVFLVLAIRMLLSKVKLLESEAAPSAPVTDIKSAVDYANKRDGQ